MKTKTSKLYTMVGLLIMLLVAICVTMLFCYKPVVLAEECDSEAIVIGKVDNADNQEQLYTDEIITVRFIENDYCIFSDEDEVQILSLEVKSGESCSFYADLKPGCRDAIVKYGDSVIEPNRRGKYTIEVVDDRVITATGELIEYTLEFDNLRKGTNPNVVTNFTTADEIQLSDPVWSAYTNGYWVDINGVRVTSIKKGSVGNIKLTAVWENPIRFNITYILNDKNGENPEENPQTYTVEDKVILRTPTNTGYASGTWDIPYWDRDDYFQDMVITAQWSNPKEFLVTFRSNGDHIVTNSVVAVYGQPMPEYDESGKMLSVPTRYDYEFKGFISNNNNTLYYNGNMKSAHIWDIASNTMLYGQWERDHFYITFEQRDYTDKSCASQIRVKRWDPFPEIKMPVRKGYKFSGYYYMYQLNNWKIYNSDGSYNYGNSLLSDAYYDISYDITLFGTWEVSDYYYFNIDKLNYMAAATGGAVQIDYLSLTYDQSYTYTTDDTLYWYDSSSGISYTRGFTCWRVILNGPNSYDANTNPWLDYSFDKTLTFSVKDVIEKYYPNYQNADTIYFRAIYNESIDDGCIATGTLITLADGTQKPVEKLTGNEQLLVWNMYSGKYDIAPILFIDKEPTQMFLVINLSFSDGTVVKVISEHGFFDSTLNKYIYLDKNAAQYLGHWFVKRNGVEYTSVQLTSVIIQEEITEAWSPVTYGHLCYYVNDMLSMPGGISGLFNIFNVDSDIMKYDSVLMEKDILTYGEFTYEEFAAIISVSQEIFEAVNGQYLKVAIGKGLITEERLQYLIDRYRMYFVA